AARHRGEGLMAVDFAGIPRRLLEREAFLELSFLDQSVLRALYHGCDRYGLAPATERALRIRLSVLDVELMPSVLRLEAAGFLTRYTTTAGMQCLALSDYDDDMGAENARKRGRPDYEPPAGPTPAERRPSAGPAPAEVR